MGVSEAILIGLGVFGWLLVLVGCSPPAKGERIDPESPAIGVVVAVGGFGQGALLLWSVMRIALDAANWVVWTVVAFQLVMGITQLLHTVAEKPPRGWRRDVLLWCGGSELVVFGLVLLLASIFQHVG